MIWKEFHGIRTRSLFLIFGTTSVLFLLPTPTEMADFMIGCSIGNFRPSSTCESVCRLLHNRTSCCYGVNYDSRAVCACCTIGSNGRCPTVCGGQCHIITVNAGNCSELRGSKHRSGVGPSIINDLSILSDDQPGTGVGMRKTLQSPRSELEEDDEKGKKSSSSSSGSSSSSSSSSTKNKNAMSTTNKLFQRLSSSLDLL